MSSASPTEGEGILAGAAVAATAGSPAGKGKTVAAVEELGCAGAGFRLLSAQSALTTQLSMRRCCREGRVG